MHGLKKWELALIGAVILTLLLGSEPGWAWWGAVFPELTPDMSAQSVSAAGAGGVELRFRTLEWLQSALRALGAL